jgi:NitT/TauT family transport system substrate-binding protein
MKTKLSLLTVSAALVGSLFMAGCGKDTAGQTGEGKNEKIKLTMSQGGEGLIWLSTYVAQEKGFFAEEGLEVENVIMDSGSKATQAVIAGEAVAQLQSTIHSVKAVSQGNDLISIAVQQKEFPVFLAISNQAAQKAGITKDLPVEERIKKLKGFKIAITSPGSSTDLLIRFLLKKVGLSPDKDVTLSPFGKGDAMLAALEKGAIDVMIYPSPYPEMAEAKKKGFVMLNPNEVSELKGFAYMTLQANKNFLKKNPAAAEKLVRAYAKANAFIHGNENGTKEIIKKKFSELDQSVLDLSYKNNVEAVPNNKKEMTITPNQIEQNLEWLNMTEKKPAQVKFEQVADNAFVEKLEK